MSEPTRQEVPQLPQTQIDALTLLAAGLTSRQIAVHLHTTESGIHQRLNDATVKLGARSRTQAVLIALYHQLVDVDLLFDLDVVTDDEADLLTTLQTQSRPSRPLRDPRRPARRHAA